MTSANTNPTHQKSPRWSKSGDWAAYGKAQDALNAALEELIRLQDLVDGAAAGTGEDSVTFTPGEDTTDMGTLGEDAEVATEDGN